MLVSVMKLPQLYLGLLLHPSMVVTSSLKWAKPHPSYHLFVTFRIPHLGKLHRGKVTKIFPDKIFKKVKFVLVKFCLVTKIFPDENFPQWTFP